MCGIIGLISKTQGGFFKSDLDLFTQSLVVDGICRGMDSTGIFSVNRSDVQVLKNSVNAMTFIQDPTYAEILNKCLATGRIIVGHNRAATKGVVTPENAHPFVKDHIILVHNGTLWNHKSLAETDVDSEAIAHVLADTDEPETAIEKIEGAFTLVWWDMKKEKLFVVRNTQRPMSITETSSYFMLSSEAAIASMILDRKNVTINAQWEIEPGMLYSFNKEGSTPEVSEVKLKSAYTTNSTYYGCPNRGMSTNRALATVHNNTREPDTSESESKTTVLDTKKIFDMPERHLQVGDRVLVRVVKTTSNPNPKVPDRWSGTIIEPGKPTFDCQGIFQAKLDLSKDNSYLYSGRTIGFVSTFVYSNCGPSVTIRDLKPDTEVTSWNKQHFSVHEVEYICENELCESCNSILDERLFSVTSCTRTGSGSAASYRVYCPDCVSKKITNEEVKENFDDLYLALQADIELSESNSDRTTSSANITQ